MTVKKYTVTFENLIDSETKEKLTLEITNPDDYPWLTKIDDNNYLAEGRPEELKKNLSTII